jgi:hypothetical protein
MPPSFEHHHRAYGRTGVRPDRRTDVRAVELSLALTLTLSAALPDRPTVFSVSPLLREALLVLRPGPAPAPAASSGHRRGIDSVA